MQAEKQFNSVGSGYIGCSLVASKIRLFRQQITLIKNNNDTNGKNTALFIELTQAEVLATSEY